MNKKGFTLTEVIIVLVILGALALILVPAMMKMMPDDHNIKYKKAFYTIQEIISDIVNDPSICQGMVNDGAGNWSTANNPGEILTLCYRPNNTSRNLAQEICERLATTNSCTTINNIDNANANGTIGILTTNNMRWNLAINGGATQSMGSGNSNNQAFQYTIYVDVDGCGNNATFNDDCVGTQTNANNGVYGITINSDGRVLPTTNVENSLLFSNPTN